MSRDYFIGLDVHCEFCEMAAVTPKGRLVKRDRCPTTIPDLVEMLEAVSGRRRVTFEEGPLAGWLARSLRERPRLVEEVVVCEPRRNHLIAKDSDKDDPIDAEKLAQLYRGGYLKAVHHGDDGARAAFRQHVALYYDRVRHRVRHANQIMAFLRQQGVFVSESAFAAAESRREVTAKLPASTPRLIREDLDRLWTAYDLAATQEDEFRQSVIREARTEDVIGRFEKLPGVGWLRAATFFVYVDTPWRFKTKAALWKYVGIGLERRTSGKGPVRLGVPTRCNKRLKTALLGAAHRATTCADNPFARQYDSWRKEGDLSPRLARRNVARSLTATMWGMWKTGTEYDPDRVGRSVRAERTARSRAEP